MVIGKVVYRCPFSSGQADADTRLLLLMCVGIKRMKGTVRQLTTHGQGHSYIFCSHCSARSLTHAKRCMLAQEKLQWTFKAF
jgi:hypothetical protein